MNRFYLLCLGVLLLSSSLLAQKKRLLYAGTIYFESGKHQILESEKKELLQALEQLRKQPQASLMIAAHTDSVGTVQYNEELANNRARAVFLFFLNQGIDSSRLDVRAYGSYSPISSNSDERGRAQNRRVSFLVQRPFLPSDEERPAEIFGRIEDAQSRQGIKTKLYLFYFGGSDSLETDEKGQYTLNLPRQKSIEIRACAKGYFFVSKVLRTDTLKEPIMLDFKLEKAILGSKMALNDLYFQGGTAVLLPSSEQSLQGLVEFLRFNEEIEVEIAGHINRPYEGPIEQNSESFRLSENRAKAVYEYLSTKGIEPKRLSYKGYGNWEMIYPKAETPLQEQVNRRVEIRVVRNSTKGE
jgi:outer membrane protein OmpA-like peptidoglycan-associated protein